jgi:hypothetical protein
MGQAPDVIESGNVGETYGRTPKVEERYEVGRLPFESVDGSGQDSYQNITEGFHQHSEGKNACSGNCRGHHDEC